MSRHKCFGFAAAVALCSVHPALAVVRDVPAGHSTIQAALDLSTAGDVILVGPGVYHENLVIGSAQNGVRLASVAGPATTTIDGGRAGSVFTISNVGVGMEIEGFTITQGGDDPPYGLGGGAYLNHASPTLRGNVIRDNFAAAGAGLFLDYSSPVVADNLILDNQAVYGSGGGIYCDHFSNATISGNVIAGNYSAAYGGGITIWDGSSPGVSNNTIVSNRGLLGGGGIFVNRNSHPACDHNIVSHNPVGGGITVEDLESTKLLGCNDVFGNGPANYSGLPDATGTNGNISLDPLFCDLGALNVSLDIGSPCRDIHAPAGCGQIGARGVGCGVATTIQVKLDIQPARCPNRVNLRLRDLLRSAILGSASFDVHDIDPTSLRLNGVQPEDSRVRDVATPFVGEPCGCTPREADGIDDLVLRFDTHALAATLDMNSRREEIVLEITGNLRDGTPLAGRDCILVLRRGGGRGQIIDLYSGTTHDGAIQRVEYELPSSAPVQLAVYDAAGRRVRNLVDASEETGAHAMTWETGGLPNGIYFYRLRAVGQVVTRKFVLAR